MSPQNPPSQIALEGDSPNSMVWDKGTQSQVTHRPHWRISSHQRRMRQPFLDPVNDFGRDQKEDLMMS